MTQGQRSRVQWVELVTAIGVLLSLIFVGLEIRQNTAVARGQARTDLASLNQDWLMGLAGDSALERVFISYWSDSIEIELNAVEEMQAFHVMVANLRKLENAYLLFEEGLIPEDALQSYGMRGPWYDSARFRDEVWAVVRGTFNQDFAAFAELQWGM